MFHITQVGVVLLTLTLCSGLFYIHDLFSSENIDKAVLSIIAWFVYIVLLWGHYHEGWRGRRVVWFSVAGAGLLTLAYFGSRVLQQIRELSLLILRGTYLHHHADHNADRHGDYLLPISPVPKPA